MKKFKTLIPAFCAMLISAVMLGTSTYAWFSVNKKVTATDMQVTAQANTQYFVVSADTTFAKATSVNLTSAAITQGGVNTTESLKTSAVYPASYQAGEATLANVALNNEWYTANTSVYDTPGNTNITNVTKLTANEEGTNTVYENNHDHFVGYTFYVGLAAKSNKYTGTLQVKATNDARDNGIKVAGVKIEQCDLPGGTTSTKQTLDIKGVETAVPSTQSFTLEDGAKCVKVTVYVYVDGVNTNVKDSNVGAEILTGSVSVVVGAAGETL